MKKMKILAFWGFCAILGSNLFAEEHKAIDHPGSKLKQVRTYKNEADYVAGNSSKTFRVEDSDDKFVFFDENGVRKAEKHKEKDKIVGSMAFTTEEKEKFKQHKEVLKPTIEYKVVGDGAFIMETHRETSFNSENDVSRANDAESALYDNTGKKILDLPGLMNAILVAPDKKHFVGWHEGETGAKSIYFYDANGALLKKNELETEFYGSGPKFSPNGKFVLHFNKDEGRTFNVYTANGDILWSYKSASTALCKRCINGCVSNSGDLVAGISRGITVIRRSKVILDKDYGFNFHKCEFSKDSQNVILYGTDYRDKGNPMGKKVLKLISLNGDILDSIDGGTAVKEMDAEKAVIQDAEGIKEYEIK